MIDLFLTFFKIGLFTFGGGYGMISIIRDECIDKCKWIDDPEFMNLIAVAESTPGPVAINMATYIGYKRGGFIGSVFATIGVVLPSLIIIYIISLFFKDLLDIKIVNDAFTGIRIAVSIIIFKTAYGLIKGEFISSKFKWLTILLFTAYFLIMFISELFGINLNAVAFILLSVVIGIVLDIIFIVTKVKLD